MGMRHNAIALTVSYLPVKINRARESAGGCTIQVDLYDKVWYDMQCFETVTVLFEKEQQKKT